MEQIEFPYKKLAFPDVDAEIKKGFEALRVYHCKTEMVNYFEIWSLSKINKVPKFTTIIYRLPDTYDIIKVVDYIENTEKLRLSTIVKGQKMSVVEQYMTDESFRKKVLDDANILPTYDKYEVNYHLREAIWRNSKEAAQFSCVMFLSLIKHFEIASIIDGCAGWGDRLFAACAAGIDYYGYDVNTDMKPSYDYITNRFGNGRQTVMIVPLENANLPNVVDAVFISPPFFDKEDYQPGNSAQSTNRFPKYRDWLDNWLIPVLVRAKQSIKPGGYLFFYYADFNGANTVGSVVNALTKSGMTYLSNGGIFDGDKLPKDLSKVRVRPLWIFKKN